MPLHQSYMTLCVQICSFLLGILALANIVARHPHHFFHTDFAHFLFNMRIKIFFNLTAHISKKQDGTLGWKNLKEQAIENENELYNLSIKLNANHWPTIGH